MNPFIHYGKESTIPLLFSCEHAGYLLPPSAPDRKAALALRRSHWGWDPGAWALTKALCDRFGTQAIGGRYSRLWVDLNRTTHDPTSMRRMAGSASVPWNQSLSQHAREQRIRQIYEPYHQAVERMIRRALQRGIRPWLFAVHTFTQHYEGEVRDYPAGILFDRYDEAAQLLGRLLSKHVEVRYNEPYSGFEGLIYSAARHGAAHDIPYLEIEWRQEDLASAGGVQRASRYLYTALTQFLKETS